MGILLRLYSVLLIAAFGWSIILDRATEDRIRQGFAYERGRKAPPEGFPKLPDIPPGRYCDQGFLALEDEYLWRRSWLYACHMDEIPEPGNFILWTNLGTSVIIVHGDDGEVRAFHNTCRHRGAPVVTEDRGKMRGFVCPYHGWTYGLDGGLVAVPEERDFIELDRACKSLVALSCERFGNWVWINFDANAEPLMEYLGPIGEEWRQFQPEDLRLVDRATFDVECSVKIFIEAFFETYHLKSIHPGTAERFLESRGTTISLWRNGHSRMVTPHRREEWVDPGTIGMDEIDTVSEIPRNQNVSYNVYPNLVTPPTATGIPFLVFWPRTARTSRVECHWFAPDWGDGPRHKLWDERLANFVRILEEDLRFAPSLQKSIESPGFKGMTLGYQERRIYHWHEELDRRIGVDRVPEGLAVPPILEPYWEN